MQKTFQRTNFFLHKSLLSRLNFLTTSTAKQPMSNNHKWLKRKSLHNSTFTCTSIYFAPTLPIPLLHIPSLSHPLHPSPTPSIPLLYLLSLSYPFHPSPTPSIPLLHLPSLSYTFHSSPAPSIPLLSLQPLSCTFHPSNPSPTIHAPLIISPPPLSLLMFLWPWISKKSIDFFQWANLFFDTKNLNTFCLLLSWTPPS